MTSQKQKWFAGAVATFGLLAFLPPTGWMVRQQLHLIGGQPMPGLAELTAHNPAIDPREQAAAAAHPDDFDEQVALAVQQTGDYDKSVAGGTGHPVVRALLALRARFDARPELSAHILRYLTMGDLKVARDRDELIIDSRPVSAETAKSAADKQTSVPKAATIALALETARRGEVLDPTNAYFTAMRALTLAAARRDGEALDAWKAAGEKTKWDDYSTEEVQGRWKLLRDAQGETSVISRQAFAAVILFPHYARIRGMARFTTSCAIRQESAGDAAGGFALRQATARVGALMRAQSKSIIGSLVGIAVTKIAAMRPGGAPTPVSRTDDRQQAEREAQYVAYLTKVGHPEEARWFVAESQAGSQVRSITSIGLDAMGGGIVSSGIGPTLTAMYGWVAGVTLLLTAFWTLTLGGLAALSGRGRRIREGQPLRYVVRFSGLAVAAALTTAVTVGIANSDAVLVGNPDGLLACGVTAIGALPLLVGFLIRLKRRQTWGSVGRELAKGFAALFGTAGSLVLLIGLAATTSVGIDRTGDVLRLFMGVFDVDGMPGAGTDWRSKILLGGVILFVPLTAMLVLAIRSRIRRIPISVGIVRGMRGFALPCATVLLLLYAAALVETRVQEGISAKFVEAIAANEGQFYAGEVHQTWPGKVTLDAPTPPKMVNE